MFNSPSLKNKMRWLQGTLALGMTLVSFTGCSSKMQKPPFEYMPNMMDSPALKAQEVEDGPKGGSLRLPVEGTIPRGFERYPYSKEQTELAGKELTNPLKPTKEVFLRGKKNYENYCFVCHGSKGLGDGPVAPKFGRPPSLVSEKIVNWPDGNLFHVITRGQNLMPAYGLQVLPEDRWTIVYYIRALQRSASPTAEDLELIQKRLKEGNLP